MPPQPQPSIKALVTKSVADAQRLAKAQMALLQTEMSATGGKIGAGSALGIATALVATARVVRLDRPASPPRSSSGDWRDEALGWDRLGIS